ncbi:hypothetical protein SAMN04488063_1856 [Halopelagius inordinatus]|uniref:Uncharacterized protein n=1 Tax=Halopelagius inordinatus TaxID=553467 RepID=A0A1I2RGJ2_9EURY|nr:hypothetical protein [Halopelagius inordinatus]SFG37727.1 hypothetical protein SAMN04488063_1856 [Halopelagius inordinatus]
MVDITFFEINLPEGTSFNASNEAPFIGGRKGKDDSEDSSGSPSLEIGSITEKGDDDSESDDSEFESEESEESEFEADDSGFDADADADSESGGGKAVPLLGLVALAVLAVAVRTLLGGSDEDAEELDELDDLSEMDVESGQ